MISYFIENDKKTIVPFSMVMSVEKVFDKVHVITTTKHRYSFPYDQVNGYIEWLNSVEIERAHPLMVIKSNVTNDEKLKNIALLFKSCAGCKNEYHHHNGSTNPCEGCKSGNIKYEFTEKFKRDLKIELEK